AGPDGAKDADTADTADTAAGPDGDLPPFPAVNHVTIRSGGVDTTVECGLDNSLFRLADTPTGYEDPHMLALMCMSPESGADVIQGFGLYAFGSFAAGTTTPVAVEPSRAEQDDTLSVGMAEHGAGWSITLDGDGGTNFTGTLTLDTVGALGEPATGTFQASWDVVSMDTDGNGAAELVEQPSALSCTFELVRE
ncbi:MAG: hypothetical protein ACK4YP_21705, partial [Myxococcota bacterium]